MFEYLRETRDGEVWRVDAVGVRGKQPIKYKDRVLENLGVREDIEVCKVDPVDMRGRPPSKM